MKRAMIPILILVLLSGLMCVSAENPVEITYKVINNTIKPGEWAKFDIVINNNDIADDWYLVKVPEDGIHWSSIAQPPTMLGSKFMILGNHMKSFRLLLKDKDLPRTSQFPVSVTLQVYSEKENTNYVTLLPVKLISGEPEKETLTDLSVGLNMPKYIDPRNSYSFKLILTNNNAKEYDNLRVRLVSRLMEKEATVTLEGNATKAVDFTAEFDENQEPTEDTITFKVYEGDSLIYEGSNDYEIVSYRLAFTQEAESVENFFKTTEEIKITNEENAKSEKDVMIAAPFFKRIITSTEPKAEIQEIDGEKNFVWTMELEPGESSTITLVTNKRIYLYLILLIAAAIFLFIMFRDPIVIQKQTEKVRTKQGGIVEMKIMLLVKNRSNKNFDHSELIERIPHLIEYKERHEHGTLPPDTKSINNKGTVLKWKLDLDAKEERIVSYYLRTKLNIIGGIKLPPALIKLKMKKGNVTIKSNPVNVVTDEVKEK